MTVMASVMSKEKSKSLFFTLGNRVLQYSLIGLAIDGKTC